MKKIVIIGSPGAGKTTLAGKLGPMLNMKVYHLDRILWKRGWKAKARDTRIDILQNLVREEQWIIEGTYIHVSELHLKAADTIIFLDISSLLCSQRLIKRHREYYRRSRRDIPVRCTDRLTWLRIFKVLTFPSRRDIPLGSTDRLTWLRIFKVLTFPFHGLRTLKQTVRSYKSKQIIRLRSPKEAEDFLAQLEAFLAQQKELLSVGS